MMPINDDSGKACVALVGDAAHVMSDLALADAADLATALWENSDCTADTVARANADFERCKLRPRAKGGTVGIGSKFAKILLCTRYCSEW